MKSTSDRVASCRQLSNSPFGMEPGQPVRDVRSLPAYTSSRLFEGLSLRVKVSMGTFQPVQHLYLRHEGIEYLNERKNVEKLR